MQKDMQTAEPLVPEPSLVEVEIAFGKLKRYQIPAELIKAGGETLCSEIHSHSHSHIATAVEGICYYTNL
jgi:hypothetical protein